MRQRRTDLALEAKELWEESARQTARLEGVEAFTETREGFLTETVHILDERGEEALGKPAGRYVTLTMDGLARREEGAFPRAARAVGGELARLMDGVPGRGLALVVGLGNRAITPDAIGPKVHEHTLVTRHLVEQIPEHFGAFRPVASLSAVCAVAVAVVRCVAHDAAVIAASVAMAVTAWRTRVRRRSTGIPLSIRRV